MSVKESFPKKKLYCWNMISACGCVHGRGLSTEQTCSPLAASRKQKKKKNWSWCLFWWRHFLYHPTALSPFYQCKGRRCRKLESMHVGILIWWVLTHILNSSFIITKPMKVIWVYVASEALHRWPRSKQSSLSLYS